MTASVIHVGWMFPPLSTFVPNRLCCTHCTTFVKPNFLPFGQQKSANLTTSCLSHKALTTAASDHNYGNKQVISLTPRMYDYLLANVREPPILRELREETATMRGSQMQVSPDQAQLLAMLVQILGAKRCIEVGVYTGYSSLAVALDSLQKDVVVLLGHKDNWSISS